MVVPCPCWQTPSLLVPCLKPTAHCPPPPSNHRARIPINTTFTHTDDIHTPATSWSGTCKGWNRRRHKCLASPGTCLLSTEPCVRTWVRPVWFGGHQGALPRGSALPPLPYLKYDPNIHSRSHPTRWRPGTSFISSFQYWTAMLEHNDWVEISQFWPTKKDAYIRRNKFQSNMGQKLHRPMRHSVEVGWNVILWHFASYLGSK